MNSRYVKGFIAVLVGMAINYLGDKRWGSISKYLQVYPPFLCLDDTYIFGAFHRGFGGILDFWSEREMVGLFTTLVCTLHQFCLFNLFRQFFYRCRPIFQVPLAYWGPCLILVVEAANFGGIIGEVLKGVYRRPSKENGEISMTVTTKITT